MQPPYQATSKETPVKKLNVSRLADSEMQKVLMAHMETNMMNLSYNGTINNQWETLCEEVYKTSVDTLGHTTRKHQDWFDENDAEILSLLEESMKSVKTPGLDGIPAEIYKYGCAALHAQLLKFYYICWTAKELPQQFKDALIIAIYKRR